MDFIEIQEGAVATFVVKSPRIEKVCTGPSLREVPRAHFFYPKRFVIRALFYLRARYPKQLIFVLSVLKNYFTKDVFRTCSLRFTVKRHIQSANLTYW